MDKMTALALALTSSVMALPDTTPCETAYDTTSGTAVCGGVNVNVFDLLCGNGFTQQTCVAKWINGGGDDEWYFFMGAGAGIAASQLPSDCSTLPDGLAMVQYYPNKDGCFPAADLNGGGGTQMHYTLSSDESGVASLQSVSVSFVEYDDGTATRNGYVKVSCSTTNQGFTTRGDSSQPSFYEVDAVAPCSISPPPPPSPNRTTSWPKSVPSNMCLLSSNGVGTCYAPLFGEKSPSVLCQDPESNVVLGARTSLLASGMIRNVMNVTVINQPTTQSDGWASLMMYNQSTLIRSGYTSTGRMNIDVNRSNGPSNVHLDGREGLNLTVTHQFLFVCTTTGEGQCCTVPPGGGFCSMAPLKLSVYHDSDCASGWKTSVQFEYSWTVSVCMISTPKEHFEKDTFFVQAFEFGAISDPLQLQVETICE